MKAILYFLLIALAGSLTAQNWGPILVNQKMNYQHSDSTYISHTIWVDSVETIGGDEIYYLNRIVKDVPGNPEIVLRNQPQFLLSQMNALEAGFYTFDNPGEFTIKTLTGVAETWVFDEQMGITAEVTSILVDNIFGVLDSVKVISLYDGNEIRLSKSFGILKFPDFEFDGNYELVGIQNTEYGESVPDFWDIFDFEVGDVFQTYTASFFAGLNETIYEWNKRTINSKEVFSDHYTYNVYRIRSGIYYGYGGYVNYYHGITLPDESYYLSDYPLTGKFQNDFIFLFDSYGCSPNYLDPNIYSRIIVYTDPYGLINKQYGTLATDYAPYEELFYPNTPQNDTFNILLDGECLTYTPHGIRYTESLGNTFTYYCDHFESTEFTYLMGYVKDGDTVGTIYPDSLLLVGVESQNSDTHNRCKVFPNPADNYVYIGCPFYKSHDRYGIEIRNLMGEVSQTAFINNGETLTLDIRNLKPGIYFYTIRNSETLVQQGKLVIQ